MAKLTARDKRYRRKLHEMPCWACNIEDETVCGHHLTFVGGGMAGKAGEQYQIPLCFWCHIEKLHRHGEKTFWTNLDKTLDEVIDYAIYLHKTYY